MTSTNIKFQQIFSSVTSLKDLGFYLKDAQFETDVGIMNFHPTKKTQ